MAAAASFNGGRSQTNLNVLQTGGEYPFLNVVKTCANFAYASAPNKDALVDPSTYDENGYPTSIQTGGYYALTFVPSSWVGQSLTVQWDGGGQIKVPGTSPIGTTTSSNGSTNNSITCTCAAQSIFVGAISTSASPNHIKNIRISLTGTETTLLNSGEVFRPAYKNRLLEAGFGVLRFLDWMSNNTTNMTDWASRKPISYVSYNAPEYRNTASTGRPKLFCGLTGGSTNAYTITGNGDGVPSSGAPVHMQMMQLGFNRDSSATITAAVSSSTSTVLTISTATGMSTFNSIGETVVINGVEGAWESMNGTWTVSAASAGSVTVNFNSSALTPGGLAGTFPRLHHLTATLSLNGTTAKPIKNWQGSDLSPGANSNPMAYNYNSTLQIYGTVIFDSALDCWMLMGGNYAQGQMGLVNGVPPEICLQLAAEIGAHPWFISPRFALDAPTDFIPSLAAYVIANAPQWMIPRYETPNEVFNTAFPFQNGNYGANKASVRWASADFTKSHGYWTSILGQAVATAYGVSQADVKTQGRYQLICGVQTYGTPSVFNQNLSSAAYVGQAAAPPSGYSKTVGVAEGWRWTTHICVAQYFNPSDYTSPEETAAVAAYQTADATTKASLLNNYVMSCIRTNPGGSTFNVAAATAQYAAWKIWAQSFSVSKICGYEGGFSPDYTGSANANNFRNDCKNTEALAGILAAVFQAFLGLSDDTFTAEFPSTFYIADFTGDGSTTTYCWTLLKGELETANTPQFDFIVRFNKGRRAINPRLRIHS